MNLGFDAKRAFHNHTGLGNYSRTLIHSLTNFFPQHQYFLFNPKSSTRFSFHESNIHEVLPMGIFSKLFTSAWRSNWLKQDLKRNKIDIYHGLSHEIPITIRSTGIPSVVTMHDLIHERYPHQYKRIDNRIYSAKFRHACKRANHIIAISKQTEQDLISFYQVPDHKITVCYQSCNPSFSVNVSDEIKQQIKQRYQLPDQFFLNVGSIIERKNLLTICKALFIARKDLNIPLVVIGEGKQYKEVVKDYLIQNNLGDKVIFLSERHEAKRSKSYHTGEDLPAIYQLAKAMIYPSIFEGFGIPVLEALASGLPVITSNQSSLPEAGGDAAFYVDPNDASMLSKAMLKVATDTDLANDMIQKGKLHAANFSQELCAANVMKVYNQLF